MEIAIQRALKLMSAVTDFIGHWIKPFELGLMGMKRHLLVVTWTCYWFDRSPGKAAQWAVGRVSYKTWITENTTVFFDYWICSSTMCVYLCLCSKSAVDKITTKAREMRIKQVPHRNVNKMLRKHCGLRIKSQMRYMYLSYQKKPQMEQENACKFLYEIHICWNIFHSAIYAQNEHFSYKTTWKLGWTARY